MLGTRKIPINSDNDKGNVTISRIAQYVVAHLQESNIYRVIKKGIKPKNRNTSGQRKVTLEFGYRAPGTDIYV